MICFTGYRVTAEKLCDSHLSEFLRAPCRKNYALYRKIIDTFLMASTSSIITQSLGKIVQRAPAVGSKMWCLYVVLRGKLPVFLLISQKSTFCPLAEKL